MMLKRLGLVQCDDDADEAPHSLGFIDALRGR